MTSLGANRTASDQIPPFARVEDAIESVRRGDVIVIVEDGDAQIGGTLMIGAEHVTADAVNFMAKHGRGLVSVCLTKERCRELRLPQMNAASDARCGTAFAVSVEARKGISTGISAHDRARTIHVVSDPTSEAADLVRPGHVFPIQVRSGGVLRRARTPEAAVDLARLACLSPAAAVCQILDGQGALAQLDHLTALGNEHELTMLRIVDLIEYRVRHEQLVRRGPSVRLPTPSGEFRAIAYEDSMTGSRHLAVVKGEIAGVSDVLVRVHPRCVVGDVFRTTGCNCGATLEASIGQINEAGYGVVVYLANDASGNPVDCSRSDTDGRLRTQRDHDAGIGFQILVDLGLTSIRVLTTGPNEFRDADAFGLEVTSEETPEISRPSLSLVAER